MNLCVIPLFAHLKVPGGKGKNRKGDLCKHEATHGQDVTADPSHMLPKPWPPLCLHPQLAPTYSLDHTTCTSIAQPSCKQQPPGKGTTDPELLPSGTQHSKVSDGQPDSSSEFLGLPTILQLWK